MIRATKPVLGLLAGLGLCLDLQAASYPVITNTAPPAKPPEAKAPAVAQATPAPPPSSPAQASGAALEKLAQPIALHPDPLISILLPAAVYPVEIVQAARFVQDTNNISKIDQQPWDDNVKALAKFPDLIKQMDANLSWTVELGQAFVEQPKELMDAIQALRAKAQKAGTLKTTPQQVVTVTNVVVVQTNVTQVVTVTNQVVEVKPANPEVIYVPTYPPTVYYPPPGYVYDPWAPLVSFGVGMAVGAIIANNCDWHGGCVWVGGGGIWVGGGGYHGDVDIDIDHNVNIDRGDRPPQTSKQGNKTGAKATQQKWQPDQARLKTAGAPTSASTRETRGWGNGAGTRPAQASTQPAGGYGQKNWSQPSAATRQTATPQRSVAPTTSSRPSPSSAAGPRPSASPSYSRPSSPSSTAFSGVSSGGGARDFSSRGASSRSFSGGGGGRGGGRR